MRTASTAELALVLDLYRTTNAAVRELDRRVGRRNVTFIQAVTILAVDAFDRPQPSLIADYVAQQSQTVTGVLDRLERAGWLRRFRDLDDRRAVRLELTKEGAKLADELRGELPGHMEQLLAGLGETQRRQLGDDVGALEASVLATPVVAAFQSSMADRPRAPRHTVHHQG
jgi:DNA-binding MarR family transcriptional regulator